MDPELKKIIEDLGKAFEELKKAHGEEIQEIKTKGAVDVATRDKIQKLNDSLDQLSAKKDEFERKLQTRVDELEKKLNRPGRLGAGSEDEETELKRFNIERKSLAAQLSRPSPADATLEQYGEYKRAFVSWVRGHDYEQKAMSIGGDPAGGYLVAADTSGRIVTRIFELSPIRQIANVQPITTDALEGLKDTDEATVGYAGETQARPATTTPQLGKWRIPVWEIYANPEATQQLLDDAGVDVEAWLGGKVSDKLARFEGREHVVGTGANAIRGFATYATAATADASRAWGVFEHIATGVNGDFAASNPADHLFDLEAAFRPGYLTNARVVTRRTVIQKIRKFRDSTGQYLWQPGLQAGKPAQLIGYPITMAEDMPALAAGSLSLSLGDFNIGYQIVDRMGVRVLRDPFSNKPFVQFYTTRRTGGDAVQFEAIKFLKFGS